MWSASALCWSSTAYPKNNNGALTGAGRLEAKASGFFAGRAKPGRYKKVKIVLVQKTDVLCKRTKKPRGIL